MKLKSTHTDTGSLIDSLKRLGRYKLLVFILAVAGSYAYLVLQINQAGSAQPTTDQQQTAIKSVPRIDQQTIDRLQQLQDNSVSVQALFNEARSNPFE